MSINKWIGMGRMAATPELRTTQSGKSVTSFTVAVDRGKDQPVDWIDCVAWEKTAEMICKWFGKGKMIAIVGHLQQPLTWSMQRDTLCLSVADGTVVLQLVK